MTKGLIMVCTHLKELYVLCEKHDLRLSGSDLIRVVCRQCGLEETCPSVLMNEYETRHPENESEATVVPSSGSLANTPPEA